MHPHTQTAKANQYPKTLLSSHMAKIFITGSTDGLGLLTAKALLKQGHEVTLHARNQDRKNILQHQLPDQQILIADLSSINECKALAERGNQIGTFDAIIHNAGVYQVSGNTEDNLPILFAVNTLAPYILTTLMHLPNRLIYLSSQMHLSGNANVSKLSKENFSTSYSDTKLHDLILAKAVARKHPEVYSNAVDPGWVPTKMGGKNAPDNLQKGYETQVWLAAGTDQSANITGQYLHHKRPATYHEMADDELIQDTLLEQCKRISGV